MLYERLMGLTEPKIPIHAFFASMQEYALGNMTGQQVVGAFNLDSSEVTESVTLYNKIMAESSANASIARRVKALEFENILVLAEERKAPFTTAAAVKTRLGV